jgi:hypothetical protein
LCQAKIPVSVVIVTVTQEKNCAGVYPVRKQELAEQVFVLRVNRKGVIFDIIVVIDILEDGTEKRTHVKMVNAG